MQHFLKPPHFGDLEMVGGMSAFCFFPLGDPGRKPHSADLQTGGVTFFSQSLMTIVVLPRVMQYPHKAVCMEPRATQGYKVRHNLG